MQRIELKSSDALKLLLENAVVPEDNSIWRPYGRKLRQGRDDTQKKRAAMAKADLDSKLYDYGIRPKK
jgi:hypothetical protein